MPNDKRSASHLSKRTNRTRLRILAIDPGTRHIGFASFEGFDLEDYGVKDTRFIAGASDVFDAVDKIVTRLISQKSPDVVVFEKNTFSQIQQNLVLTLALAKMKQIVRRRQIKVAELAPRSVRKIVTQDGNSTKIQTARVLIAAYPELAAVLTADRQWRVKYLLNSTDAVAVGLAYLKMHQSVRQPREV